MTRKAPQAWHPSISKSYISFERAHRVKHFEFFKLPHAAGICSASSRCEKNRCFSIIKKQIFMTTGTSINENVRLLQKYFKILKSKRHIQKQRSFSYFQNLFSRCVKIKACLPKQKITFVSSFVLCLQKLRVVCK